VKTLAELELEAARKGWTRWRWATVVALIVIIIAVIVAPGSFAVHLALLVMVLCGLSAERRKGVVETLEKHDDAIRAYEQEQLQRLHGDK
jgi:hypothetical protein